MTFVLRLTCASFGTLARRAFSSKPFQSPPVAPSPRSYELPCASQPARFKVAPDDCGVRLDRFIKSSAPGLPPGLIHRHIRQSRVKVNGQTQVNRAIPVHTDDVVSFPGDVKLGLTRRKKRPPADDVSLSEAALVKQWLLYRDARVAVINKPPGLPVLDSPNEESSRTLEQLLCGLGAGRYWLVHRMHTQVSGAILIARDVGAVSLLSDYIRARMVTRVYWGLVAGVPQHKKGIVDFEVGGKKAVTRYRVVQMVDNHYSWLELEPRTGRANQISIHCAEGLGTPLVGDVNYDNVHESQHPVQSGALQLCSRSITFPRLTQVRLPKRQKQKGKMPNFVTVQAPLPAHMKDTWRRLGMQERFADES
ncbi:RNA pseudouridylate synthase [Gracilaria domingensis]|nr:RNA pseudouridylate synthase [Gracilaria domingensis]